MRTYGWLLVLAAALLLAGCGSFPLAGGVHALAGQSPDRQQLDALICKDQAEVEANSAGRQVGKFFLELTTIGSIVSYQLDKAKHREVFAECLTARGYTVYPVGYEPERPAPAPVSASDPCVRAYPFADPNSELLALCRAQSKP